MDNYCKKYQHLINSTLSSVKFPKSLANKLEATCVYFASGFIDQYTLPWRSNISRFSFLPLHVREVLHADLYETSTNRKHWNQATKHVHGTGSEIHVVILDQKL